MNSLIIADTYQIEQEIGSGGGGVVYLARHMRLNKLVVLKGDKRSLTSGQETLRREVDSLKNLSHTYIPQVYDYVWDNGIVYTVMDYVEGESLNKPLDRGERFEQPRIIAWAKQLLEAVSYLHKRPPHGILHADIKPANIMLTPQDDIRLIDFNIALLLGEEGAIAVGRSFGYASPEHYGIDYSIGITVPESSETCIKTELIENEVTPAFYSQSHLRSSSPISSGKKRLLDARSDIYSIGATLYHLLTGERPNKDATDAVPVLRQNCSFALAVVIEKAMNPDPDLRYQSADEMLYDILHLRDNDPRVRRWKRIRLVSSAILILTFLAGSASALSGSSQAERVRREKAEQLQIQAEQKREEEEAARIVAEKQREEEERQRKEAERLRRLEEMRVQAANSADTLRAGDRQGAIEFALSAIPSESDIGLSHIAEAKKALADALGIYDLSDGFRPYKTVRLPAKTVDIAIAPDGKAFAAMSLERLSVFDTGSGELLDELPAVESGLADVQYIDNNTIVYAASGGLTMYDIFSKSTFQIGDEVTTIAVSSDRNTVAAANRDSATALIYNIESNTRTMVTFGDRRMWAAANDRLGDPNANIFRLNNNGSLLAVSFSNGGLEIFDATADQEYIEIFDESDYKYFEGGFNGKYFAFSARNDKESLFAIIDVERFATTVSTTLQGKVGAFADENGIYMVYNDINVSIDPVTARQTPLSYDPRDQIAGGYRVKGSLNSPTVLISKYESHRDKVIINYDPDYMHDEARLNVKKSRIMLFSFSSFRIYDFDGRLVKEISIPNAEQIYDQQYRRDNGESYLEVIYYDGTIHKYSGDDGKLIAVEAIAPPDPSLYEEFTTDNLRITAPLNGTPIAYDIFTGDLIRKLEKDGYLTYVTQVGECVITEYLVMRGDWCDRYGLLLDGKTCETLAYIPNLCDVVDNKLIIDDSLSGSLREIRLFSIEEQIEMARTMLE